VEEYAPNVVIAQSCTREVAETDGTARTVRGAARFRWGATGVTSLTLPHAARLSADDGSLSVALTSLSFLVVGAVTGVAFHAGLYLDVVPGVVAFWLLTIVAIRSSRLSRLSLLPRFLILIYAFPFSALLGYLLSPDFVWVYSPHGFDIMQDKLVVRQMIAIGTVGLCGLAAGIHAARFKPVPTGARETPQPSAKTSLGLLAFLLLVAVAVTLSGIAAPAETILEKMYMIDQSATAASQINFAAASLVSYILVVTLAIDVEREGSVHARRTKLFALGLGTAYIVIVFQVLRGDRESSGLIVALSSLYLTSPLPSASPRFVASAIRKRILSLVAPLLLVVIVFVTLGAARYMIVASAGTLSTLTLIQLGLAENTWTAVLWTNLSAAWEFRHGVLNYKLGETYLHYLLSLPPGIVTSALGISRPLESWQGIAHENPAGISAGGLHVVIAPFKNFGMAGALLILFLYGWIAGRLEILNIRPSLMTRLLWASVLCGGFFWFWYGDMVFIRAIMAALAFYWVYRLALSLDWVTSRVPATIQRADVIASRHLSREHG
ncbi:MAG TPA: hypothetical protein VNJ04_19465, partial [Gemmatimonadaceae bacterium]|nr:hypothetical protein [Gemmatimonadaceae bacterium]